MGLVKGYVGQLVNQPHLPRFENCWRTTDDNQISTVKKDSKHRPRWGKLTDEKNIPMYTKEWIKFNWGNLWCSQKLYTQRKKWLKN